jgi:hypothetical protein
VRSARALLLVVAIAAGACADPDTDSQHQVSETTDGTVFESSWTYRSFDVDVDLWLATNQREGECFTTATLRVNDVISAADTYGLEPTDCSALELTREGDIVLYQRATGHRWADEQLSVDTDDEVVILGPAAIWDPLSGEPASVAFTLSAPPCADDRDCDCGVLIRYWDTARDEFPLGRTCD